jgi:uncharacterized membrane protein YjjP (DUF1212 family)
VVAILQPVRACLAVLTRRDRQSRWTARALTVDTVDATESVRAGGIVRWPAPPGGVPRQTRRQACTCRTDTAATTDAIDAMDATDVRDTPAPPTVRPVAPPIEPPVAPRPTASPGRALIRHHVSPPAPRLRRISPRSVSIRRFGTTELIGLEEPGEPSTYRAMDLALRIGELMLASGESTEAVADAMRRVTRSYGLPQSEANVTFSAISLSYLPGQGAPPVTGERRVRRRLPDFSRLIDVHRLVQETTREALDLDRAFARLREIKLRRAIHPNWLIVVALATIAGSASVMVGGGALMACVAFAATILADRAGAWLARCGIAEFFQMVAAASIGSAMAVCIIWIDGDVEASAVVIGSVIALLPGRALVTSLQDGITGDFVTSAARMLEVFFVVAGIIAGVGITLYVGGRLGVPIHLSSPPQAPPSLRAAQLLGGIGVSVAFAVSLLLPWNALLPVGVGGAFSWVLFALLRGVEVPPVLASFVAATVVGLAATAYARSRGLPSYSYAVPSIAPLLPGSALYAGMLELNTGSASTGALILLQAISTALALGAGVNLGAEIVRAMKVGGLGRRFRPVAHHTHGH